MSDVLISIQSKWVEKIANGKKTVEVRKSRPKLQTPFKVYIYATQPKKKFDFGLCFTEYGKIDFVCKINYELAKRYNIEIISGKVIGEFICDRIEQGHILWVKEQPEYYDKVEEKTQLTYREMFDYLGESGIGYFWHISQLKIYDKPKELSEFKRWNRTEENIPCAHAKWLYPDCKDCKACNLTRPPQSWCYVEELQE